MAAHVRYPFHVPARCRAPHAWVCAFGMLHVASREQERHSSVLTKPETKHDHFLRLAATHVPRILHPYCPTKHRRTKDLVWGSVTEQENLFHERVSTTVRRTDQCTTLATAGRKAHP